MPNLLPIPSNAFSGAAVKVDNSPIDKFLLQNTYAKAAARQLCGSKILRAIYCKNIESGARN